MSSFQRAARVYRLTRPLVRSGFRLFFSSIEIQDGERIPDAGPVVLAANHPNSIMDPFALGVATERPVHFLARSGIFTGRLKSAFLSAAGVVPVYRRQDDAEEMHRNIDTFATCFEVLERGGAIGIFPEGVTHSEPRVLPLKTGAARLVLGAEARNDYRLGVRLIPVGLTYSEPQRFRGRLLLACGGPIEAADFADLHRTDERKAVRQLTLRLQRRLETLVLNLPSAPLAMMLADLRELYAADLLEDESIAEALPAGLAGETALGRQMRGAVAYFHGTAPALADELHRKVRRFNRLARRLRLRRETLTRRRNAGTAASRRDGRLWVAVGGAPAALYGLVLNWLPYQATRAIARRYAPRETFVATAKFLAGGLAFGIWYALLGVLAWRALGLLRAAAFVASLPFAGLWTLSYQALARDILEDWRDAVLKRRNRRVIAELRRRRAQLVAELDSWKQRYLANRGRRPEAAADGGTPPEPR